MNLASIAPPTLTSCKPTSWFGVGSLALGSFALVTSEFLVVGLLPSIASSLDISTGQAGLTVTVPGLTAALAAPLTIAVAGQMDRKTLLIALLVATCFANVLTATSTNIGILLTGRILLGFAVGSFWTIAGSLGPRLRPGAEGIRANALILAGISFGIVAGVPAGSLIGDAFGWRSAFWVAALMAVIPILAVTALLPALPGQSRLGIKGLPVLLSRPKVRLGLIAVVTVFVGHFGSYTYITPFLNQRTGVTGPMLSMALLANGMAAFVGNAFGGWLASRSVNGAAVASSLLIGLSSFALLLLGEYQTGAFLAVVVWGAGFGMLPIAMQSFLQGAAPDALENMQALFTTVTQLSIGFGAFAGGLIVDYAGLEGVMAFCTAAAVFSSLIMLSKSARY